MEQTFALKNGDISFHCKYGITALDAMRKRRIQQQLRTKYRLSVQTRQMMWAKTNFGSRVSEH